MSGGYPSLFGYLSTLRVQNFDVVQQARGRTNLGLAAIAATGSASDITTGTLSDNRLSSNVVLRNISNVFTTGNTFQATQVFDASIVVGGLIGPRIRNVGQVFRLNNNGDTARAGLEVGDITSTGNVEINSGQLVLSDLANSLSWKLKTQTGVALGQLDFISHTNDVKASLSQAGRLTLNGAVPGGNHVGLIVNNIAANAAGVKTQIQLPVFNGSGGSVIESIGNSIDGYMMKLYHVQPSGILTFGTGGDNERMRIDSAGLVSIGMPTETGRSLSILPQNTSNRTGVRVYDYGAFVSDTSQSGFEVAYMGGTFAAPSTTVTGHSRNLLSFRTGGSSGALSTIPSFAIRSTIGPIIGSALSEVNTSMMVTPTSTGVPIAAITMLGQSGYVDFPQGHVFVGSTVRLKNNGGDFQVRNGGDTDFVGISASTGNFSNVLSASNGIKVSGSSGVQFSSATPVPGSGSIPWFMYTANTNALFTRDILNSRMQVSYTGGANAAAALTQFHSRVTVDDRLVVSSGQTGNTLQATFTNTTSNQPVGFRLNNGSWDIGFRTNPNNGWFEITESGGNIRHRWHANDYILANSGKIYFSSESSFGTSGVGGQDLGLGRVSAGTLRIYNSAGNDGSLQALNGVFSGTVTSAFQTLSSDPSTLDIGTGMSRLVKNTTSGKIAKFVNDGGVIKEAGVSNAQIVVAPTGTTATITLVNSASQTLDLGSATGTVAVTLTTPGIVSKGSIIVKQGTTVRDFNVSVSSGTLQWIGYETDWATMAASSSSAFGWIYDGSVTYLFAADSSAGVAWGDITGKPNPITNIANGKLSFRIDGGGVAPTTGAKKVFFPVPYNCTITGWELVADASGSIVIDIWKDTYANYAPTNADSITASAKPTLSSAIKANSTTLTGWTTTLNAGDYIELEVESASTLTVVVLTLTVTKT